MPVPTITNYDVIIVGAGIAGSALAHNLANTRPKGSPPLRIALLERTLTKPDRIVGELLQPGGMNALRTMGLSWCTEDIDAVPVHGYCVVYEGKTVEIPYPAGAEGRSFHHGEFIMQLRKAARQAPGVEMIEATATDLIEDPVSGRVLGVRANRKTDNTTDVGSSTTISESLYASITIAADGAYSKFRTALGTRPRAPVAKSQFFGAILKHAPLPMKYHGTVALIPGSGPVLMYQIGTTETRMLADVKLPLPSDIKDHLRTVVIPNLPPALQPCVTEAIKVDRLRSMPNQFLPAAMQAQHGSKEGIILVGDAWNMRHPLTGGGMTVAFNDVVLLTEILRPYLQIPSTPESASLSDTDSDYPFSSPLATTSFRGTVSIDWDQLGEAIRTWHWSRKGLSSTINILSVALYDLFGADDVNLHILREGCFGYFQRGGESVNGPVSLLSGLAPSPLLLARHFFAVAFYAIYVFFNTPRKVHVANGEKPVYRMPSVYDYPAMVLRSFSVVWTAIVVFGPLVWSEIRWW